jgi:hypothetical protein
VSLAERLEQARPRMRGLPCPMAVIIPKLDEADRVALLNALELNQEDPAYLPTTTLAQVLTEDGHRIHYKSVAAHRNMVCRCFTGTGK